jgi:catechol 2,3-dioxygenase-like lactoylglutathione lyase family enzyme
VEEEMTTLNRLEHVNLSCQDLEASQAFYQALFPDWYVRAEDRYDQRPWIHLGDDQFYISLNHTPELKRVHEIYENIGVNHVGFVINNGEEFKVRLEENKIDYYTLAAPEIKHRIYVSDPDGNEIELVEYNSNYRLR